MATQAHNPSIWEAEAGDHEFKGSLGYKKTKNKKRKKEEQQQQKKPEWIILVSVT
jgi:hypothetical protein